MSIENANLVSTTYTGNTIIPAKRGREYLLIQSLVSHADITFGGGTGAIHIPTHGFYEPLKAPSTEISVITTGTFVVVTNI